jgi:hypothetical protein
MPRTDSIHSVDDLTATTPQLQTMLNSAHELSAAAAIGGQPPPRVSMSDLCLHPLRCIRRQMPPGHQA